MDNALAKDIGVTSEEEKEIKKSEEEKDKKFKAKTMGEIEEAIELISWYVKSHERAEKALGKISKAGPPGGDLISKMMGSAFANSRK